MTEFAKKAALDRVSVPLMIAIFLCFLGACATNHPPSRLLETEVVDYLRPLKSVHPEQKIYRQYVSNDLYFQFDRMSPDNTIYGWLTCTDCSWTREKIAAVYDGSYLYVVYGHHEDLFRNRPQRVPMLPDAHWSWNVVEKFQVEGRNLIKLSQIRKCDYDSPAIKEWRNSPYTEDDSIFCERKRSGSYKSVYVSTVDETLAGRTDSMVGSDSESIKERLNALSELYRDGDIDEEEYTRTRREILEDV